MPFEDEWLLRQGELDAAFGEGFFLEPLAQPELPNRPGRVDVNADLVVSSTRPLIPFVGTFVDAGALLHAHGRSKADNWTQPVAAERPMIDVAEAALPQRPQVGDRIHRTRTGTVFTVQTYLPEAPVRAWIYLAEAGPRPETPR